MYPYTISTTDTFVQIDTRIATSDILIKMSTSAISSGNITIRDIGGNASFFDTHSIQISTLDGSVYNDSSISQYITKPYGAVTLNGNVRPNTWLIQNEYDNVMNGKANSLTIISSFTASNVYVSSLTVRGPISTVDMNAMTQAIQNGSTIATTVFWSTSIYMLPTSGPGGGYVASTVLQTNIVNMAANYTYISSSWLSSLNIKLASAFSLVSSLTYISTLSSITSNTYGYMSTVVTGASNGFVQYIGGSNVGCISSSGTCDIVPGTLTATYTNTALPNTYTYTFSNTFLAKNISTIGNLKFNTIVSPNIISQYNTLTLLNTSRISDYRIKKDIKPITNALSKIRKIRGVSYRMKDTFHLGCIAQELEGVLPEVVGTSKIIDEMKVVYYGDMVGLLIEGIKELKVRIDALEPYFK